MRCVVFVLFVAMVVSLNSNCEGARLFRRGRVAQPIKSVKHQAIPLHHEEIASPDHEAAASMRGTDERYGYYGSPFRFPSWGYSHGPSYGGPYWGTFTDQPYFRFGPELRLAR